MINKTLDAEIFCNEKIASEVFRLILECNLCKEAARPGQFVNVYLRDKSLLLPRPISICFAEESRVTLVYKVVGKGTKELAGYKTGEHIKVSTPLGNGYDIDTAFRTMRTESPCDCSKPFSGDGRIDNKTIALVAGGLGVPPMVELAKRIKEKCSDKSIKQNTVKKNANSKNGLGIRLIAVAGFQEEVFLTEELKKFCDEVYLATERGTEGYRGNVLELMETRGIKADYYFACGPKPMLKAVAGLCGKLDKPLQVSLEERMGCGYGACVGCTCKTQVWEDGKAKIKQKKVCKDGPVFFGNEVIWDE